MIKSRNLLAAVLTLGVALGGATLASGAASPATSSQVSAIVEPAAGYSFFYTQVAAAKKSVDLSMYELADQAAVSALVGAEKRGVAVRVILDSAYSGQYVNQSAYGALVAGGVKVVWAPSGVIFHAKYFVVDGNVAYVGTGNLTAKWYSSTRDYFVRDTNSAGVAAIEGVFNADFAGVAANLASGSGGLVWSPGSQSALVGLIGSATKSVIVENEEMSSSAVLQALESAARRGVHVDVAMTYSSSWSGAFSQLKAAGVSVHVLSSSQVYIHAKAICADNKRLFVGSENFSTSSLSYNRELGVVVPVSAAVSPIVSAMQSDFASGRAW